MTPRSVLLSFLTYLALLIESSAWTAPSEASSKARTDRYGDPLPLGAVARMGSVLFYHGAPCTALAYSPDGRILAVSGGGGNNFNISAPFESRNSIRLLDAETGRQRHQLPGHSRTHSLHFSPDGRHLISKGHDEEGNVTTPHVKIWDVATGKELHRLIGQDLSHDGKTLLVRVREKDTVILRFVSIATGKELRRITVPTVQFWYKLVFAPDDKTLAGDVGGFINIWDVARGKVLHRMAGIKNVYVDWLAYSPTGETLMARFNDGTVKLWDTATGKELHQWDKSTGFGEFYPCYSPDGKMLVGAGAYETIQLWNIKTGKESSRIKTTPSSPASVVMSREGKKLAWGTGHGKYSVHLWDLMENKEVHPPGRLPLPIQVVAFSPDGKTLLTSGHRGQPIRSWEVATGKELRQIKSPNSYKPPVLSSSGRLFAVQEQKLRLFDLTSDSEIALRGDLPEDTKLMTFSPNGRTLAVDVREAPMRLWDTATGRERRSLGEGKGKRYGLVFTEDGKTLLERIVGEEGPRIRFWDVATGNLLRSVRAFGHPVYVSISPDGRLGAGVVKAADPPGMFSEDVRIVVWDVKTGEQLRELRAERGRVSHPAFSPDSRSLACAYEVGGVIRLWEVATGQERKRFEGHRQLIRCLAFSADGSLLATGSDDHTALVWDVLGRLDNGPAGQNDWSDKQLHSLWDDLAAKDAMVAYGAMCQMLSGKQSVRFLKKQLRPAAGLDARQREQVSRWIADLDSSQFEAREKAARELEKLDDHAEPVLRAALANKPSLKVRKRIQPLLKNLDAVPSPQRIQSLRAVEVLEHIATSEARELLRAFAGGAPSQRLTAEAKMALQRLDRNALRPDENR